MEWWLGYAAIGAAVGFFAGMLGIGGGAIMVPLLVMIFEAQGLPKAQVLHLAVGTAMATILFTSVASVRAHAARGAIRWDIARNVTPGILLGGLVGSWIASFIPPLVFAAIGTAAVIGFPIALSGTIGFVVTGLRETGLPPYSVGFVYLPGLVGIIVSSMLMAPVGAAAAHRLPTRWLKRIFAVLFYVMATRMLLTFL